MWSVGCLFAEFLLKTPLLPGKGEFDQLDKIFKLLGTPSEETWEGFNELPAAKNFRWKQNPRSHLRAKFPREPFKQIYLSDIGFDLLSRMLMFDPKKRITAKQALEHPYWQEAPMACEPSAMPAFVSNNEARLKKQLGHGDDLAKPVREPAEGFHLQL